MFSSPRHLVLIFLFLLILSTSASTRDSQDQSPQSTSPVASPILLAVTVFNKNEFVTGLKQDNFQITIDKIPAKILEFNNESTPVSLGILLDASGSMQKLKSKKGTKLRIIQEALASFVALSNASNEYFLIGFNESPQLVTDWTSRGPLISDDFLNLKPSGNTALWDACYLGINKLQQQGRHRRRVMILISDGLDTNSRYSFDELRRYLKETGIVLFGVHISDFQLGTWSWLEGQATLEDLSVPSGGVMFTTLALTPKAVADTFSLIANELRNQYTIAIEPLAISTDDKKWHKLSVKVKGTESAGLSKEPSVRTRAGFYALPNQIKNR